jgi:RimJ/RimL family protein N-acetyltransferase
VELFGQLPYVLNDELGDDLSLGRRRPEWMWVALRGDRLVARLARWARQPGSKPFLLEAGQYDREFMSYRSPQEWWRIATLPDGDPVGFVIPARNSYHPIIAYIGVLPAHRGNGYIDDLLAEGTRILAAHDVPRTRAATDLGNVPMARAFQRAGYVNFEREIDMTWS